jgi:hypothetical protein
MIKCAASEQSEMADYGLVPKTPKRPEVAFSVRVRPEVAVALREQAAANRRSINREIELYIDEALERRRQQQEGQGEPLS